jgi:hypothetical protein
LLKLRQPVRSSRLEGFAEDEEEEEQTPSEE